MITRLPSTCTHVSSADKLIRIQKCLQILSYRASDDVEKRQALDAHAEFQQLSTRTTGG